MNFKNFKIASRLAIVFGIVLTISVVASALSLAKLSDIQENLRDVVLNNNVKIKLNAEMNDAVYVVARVMRSIVLLEDKAAKDHEVIKIEKARADYDKSWDALQKFPASEAGKAMRAKIVAAKDLAKPVNTRVIELGLAGQVTEAKVVLFKDSIPLTQKWQEALEENITLQEAANAEHYQQAELEYHQARNLLLAANALSIALAVVLGWFVTRSITQQLGGEPSEAADLAKAVAAGDLSVDIQLRANDTQSMMANLKRMQESLVMVVRRVRQGSDGVSTASAEIAQGNHDLSGRTEEQASSLEETAASMEQLSATVKQNADSARLANQLAVNASTVASKGGEVVGQVVETMKGINESSRKIADIISVIDGIAFQTNILALNAAVEAARAGEQGRGFAVVATEVRSLAGRSAQAAKEIKALIGASVERVEFGTHLVDQAGATMIEVVNSIKRVTDLMGEISAASSEQSAGVSQVGEAVVQMDQVTQQNAALVEEMAAAASSLKSQATELVQTVAVFKLDHGDDVRSVPAPSRPVTARFATAKLPSPALRKGGTPGKPHVVTSAKATSLPAMRPALAVASGADDGWDTF